MVNEKLGVLMVNEKNKDIHELHISLESEIFEKVECIKNYHGIKNLTEIIRFLITKEHRNIGKSESAQDEQDLMHFSQLVQ